MMITQALITKMTPQEFLIKYTNFTHADLANLLGCAVVTVHSWSAGTRNPPEYVCRYLDRLAQDFEDWKEDKRRKDNSIAYALWLEKVCNSEK